MGRNAVYAAPVPGDTPIVLDLRRDLAAQADAGDAGDFEAMRAFHDTARLIHRLTGRDPLGPTCATAALTDPPHPTHPLIHPHPFWEPPMSI